MRLSARGAEGVRHWLGRAGPQSCTASSFGRQARLGAETLRVGRQVQERPRGGRKEQSVERGLVAKHQGLQGLRQREEDVEVLDGQDAVEPGLTNGRPAVLPGPTRGRV